MKKVFWRIREGNKFHSVLRPNSWRSELRRKVCFEFLIGNDNRKWWGCPSVLMDSLSPPSPSSSTILFLSPTILFLSLLPSYFSLSRFSCISSWKFHPEILTLFTLTPYLDLQRNPESLSNLLSLCKVTFILIFCSSIPRKHIQTERSNTTHSDWEILRGATRDNSNTRVICRVKVLRREKIFGEKRGNEVENERERSSIHPGKSQQASNGQYNPVCVSSAVTFFFLVTVPCF